MMMKITPYFGALLLLTTLLFTACDSEPKTNANSTEISEEQAPSPEETTEEQASIPDQAIEETDEMEEPAPDEFNLFLTKFLKRTFSRKNFDSLVYVSSPLITKYINTRSLGFGRFTNPGMYCTLYDRDDYGYNFSEEYFGEKQPSMTRLPYFPNAAPKGGTCDEADSPDGIYYQPIDKLPNDWDVENDEPIRAPAKFNNLQKMEVKIQYRKMIIKTLYFIAYKDKWYLLYIDDCDCSSWGNILNYSALFWPLSGNENFRAKWSMPTAVGLAQIIFFHGINH